MRRFGLVVAAILLLASGARACSVPVFRYALERWAPSSLYLYVFHRGDLSKQDRDTIRQITDSALLANVAIEPIDVSEELKADARVAWEKVDQTAKNPLVVLRYAETTPEVPNLWTGPLDAKRIEPLLRSTARRAAFEHLTTGSAAIVLLMLSGDRSLDDAARAMLRRELPLIASRIELPAPTTEGPQLQSLLPMRLDFPIVEIANDALEAPFRQMLLASEDGLDKVKGPIAFPVFGRGRALCSLHSKDLEKPGELQRSIEFLCKACSCQAKELNPGVDLLIAGNWEQIFDVERGPMPRVDGQVAETRPEGTTSVSRSEVRSPPPSGYSAVEVESNEAIPEGRPFWLRLLLFGGMVGLTISIGSIIRGWNRKSKSGGEADAAE